ncbi:MAG: amidohydrolase family protein [Candidatus Thermoplasmatota archaeon]
MAGRALLNARIHPMAPGADPWNGTPWLEQAEAICWKEGVLLAVGSNRDVLAVARTHGIAPEDAAGLLVLPGFVDAHTHFLHIGVKAGRPALNDCRNKMEALAATAQWLAAHPVAAGEIGAVIAEGWDESEWPGRERPTRADLDALVAAAGTPDRPLVLRRVCGHIAVANSAALTLVRARWDDDALVALDSGLLLEAPSLYLNEVLPSSPAQLDAALAAACSASHALGITTVGDYSQAPYREALRRAAASGRLTVRTSSSIYTQQLDAEQAAGFRTGRRHDGPQPRPLHAAGAAAAPGRWLRDGGLKVFHDGSLGARTAALRSPYHDAPPSLTSACGAHDGAEETGKHDAGGASAARRSRHGCVGHPHPRGTLNWGDGEVERLFATAHAAGIQLHAHAIGDAAIDQGLEAFEAIAARADLEGAGWGANRLRHRFEHYEIHHDEQLARTAELGIVASSQPNFVGTWSAAGGMYEERLGAGYRLNNRFRTLKQASIRLAFGSDGMPPGPLVGLASATEHPDSRERLDPLEAAWHYTWAAAWGLHWEDLVGSLEAGKRADVVVLEARDLKRPASWRLRETIVDGITRFKR